MNLKHVVFLCSFLTLYQVFVTGLPFETGFAITTRSFEDDLRELNKQLEDETIIKDVGSDYVNWKSNIYYKHSSRKWF